jgi:hypothetical protein
VRIVDIRETVVPIKSQIRNAFIDFGQMTVRVLALITDVVREGKPMVGFGFNSNGRYAPSGLLRERFIPRLKAADSDSLLTFSPIAIVAENRCQTICIRRGRIFLSRQGFNRASKRNVRVPRPWLFRSEENRV